jgi:hypothetical protein
MRLFDELWSRLKPRVTEAVPDDPGRLPPADAAPSGAPTRVEGLIASLQSTDFPAAMAIIDRIAAVGSAAVPAAG